MGDIVRALAGSARLDHLAVVVSDELPVRGQLRRALDAVASGVRRVTVVLLTRGVLSELDRACRNLATAVAGLGEEAPDLRLVVRPAGSENRVSDALDRVRPDLVLVQGDLVRATELRQGLKCPVVTVPNAA